MPQASDEQRAQWGISDGTATRFLESRGYVLTRQFTWVPPTGHLPTDKEWDAVQFLIDEWDFGGVCAIDGSKVRI
jgi:hypothetical protein